MDIYKRHSLIVIHVQLFGELLEIRSTMNPTDDRVVTVGGYICDLKNLSDLEIGELYHITDLFFDSQERQVTATLNLKIYVELPQQLSNILLNDQDIFFQLADKANKYDLFLQYLGDGKVKLYDRYDEINLL
ncbi:hypothetical protein QAD02_019859 [Eretmocerus hayati]|uniref:Uncharacterized protein n=3 Tax=Eretmocerus hayati TaxID=131215 RepID=A0ACC2P3L8_9HYME|nr:hypothetical protein QAD02_004839 [Eretmocerus hayati]KAJ8678189.1 hypothetical protein QAD02_013976 [Eretmocerus hayati]KAJ8684067.1 hypothetical protein QAD02_019859 [Eretmocerus hayati]